MNDQDTKYMQISIQMARRGERTVARMLLSEFVDGNIHPMLMDYMRTMVGAFLNADTRGTSASATR